MEKLKIEYVDINSIKPYKNNAKEHPREQIEQIKKSIQKFGMDDPIVIWHNEIVEGHGRLIACKELGYTEVPIIRLDHLTDEERRAYTLAHNKLTMNSDFDIDILNNELASIDIIDMSEFGFDALKDIEDDLEEEAMMNEEVKGEVPFTNYIDEESQYIVLKFDNIKDWNYAQTILGLSKVKDYSTRKDGKSNKMSSVGLGRVIDGIEGIRKIQKNSEELK